MMRDYLQHDTWAGDRPSTHTELARQLAFEVQTTRLPCTTGGRELGSGSAGFLQVFWQARVAICMRSCFSRMLQNAFV